MNKKYIIATIVILLTTICFIALHKNNNKISELSGVIIEKSASTITIQDENDNFYTFVLDVMELSIGDSILLKYTGLLDEDADLQKVEVIDYSITPRINNNTNIIEDDGIFSNYYELAKKKLNDMSLDEKIGQILLVRYSSNKALEDLKKYYFAGFVFFENDFVNKTKNEVINMIDSLQKTSSIPLLTAVDEEGGKVVRVSSNPNLVSSKFASSQELYNLGGLDKIAEDTKNKSKILKNLGLNLNLAPVVDVSTDPNDYMYQRSLGKDTAITSQYAKTVINASKGTGVSYTLKHFPGYGNNSDTHSASSIDSRTYQDIVNNDIPPFEEGIKAGAEAIMVSHNIISSIDNNNPASLSRDVHNILRNNLNFTGVIITDNLDMQAVNNIDDAIVKAIVAGNDLIITTNYVGDINKIKTAIQNDTITERDIDNMALRVLAWKYYKGLMFTNQK